MRIAGRVIGVAMASLVAAFFVGPGAAMAVTDIDNSRYIIRPTLTSEPNTQSGAFQQTYPLTLPPGRNGMQPSLNLQYSSADTNNASIVGYGWSLSIPSIRRLPKHGTDELYTRYDFTSSLSGELSAVALSDATHGTFAARVDDGSMMTYTYAADETWTVVDKNGTTYTFGDSSSAQVVDPSDTTRVYEWMLGSVEDILGNTVSYTYTTDGAQVYPSGINYTSFGSTSGIFDITFTLESRTDAMTSHAAGFAVTTSYRVSTIEVAVDGQTVRSYALAYDAGDGGARSLLASITETATTEDGASSLTNPATTFSYADGSSAWTSGSVTFPETIAGDSAGSLGLYLFDMNNDAIPDIIKGRDGDRAIYTGNTDGTWTASSVTPPIDFATPVGRDMGVRVMDFNGDGALDLVYARYDATGTLDQAVYLNNGDGTGWTESTGASVPLGFTNDGGTNFGVDVMDVDGDGLPDIVKSRDGEATEVYINNGDGTGWTLTSGYTVPVYFASSSGVDMAVRPMDANGDGLVDLVYARYPSGSLEEAVYLNNGDGSGWSEDTSWTVPLGFLTPGTRDMGVRPMDVNSDGLVDLVYHRTTTTGDDQAVYLNTGSGWSEDTSITSPLSFTTDGGLDLGVRVDDFDGDGLADIFKSRNTGSGVVNELYSATGEVADLLTSVTTSQDASTEVTYASSVNGNNADLPFVLQTTSVIVTDDGLGNSTTKTYEYAGGDYYYASEFDRAFAGFGTMTATDDDGTTTNFFHQGNDTNSAEGESTDSRAKMSQQYREERADTSGQNYSTSINTWDSTSLGTDRDFIYRSQALELLYGSASSHVDSASAFTYDGDGNVLTQTEYGEVTGADDGSLTDTGSDARTTTTTYAVDASDIVRNKPSSVIITDEGGTTAAQALYLYDGLAYGSVSDGLMTTEQQWISGSSYADTTYTYDAYGNVLTITAPNGGVQTTVYDTVANQYPSTITNALSQVTTMDYALSVGKPTSVTRPSGSMVTTSYDAFGRPASESKSSDTSATTMVTSKTWSYDNTSSPRSVTAREFLSTTLYKESISYLDGFDRVIEIKILDDEATGYDESETVYDALGRVSSTTLVQAAADGSFDADTVSSDLAESYAYDALGRLTSATNVLGTTSTSYDGFTKTVTDAIGNEKDYTTDGLGRLIEVVENIDGVGYTTSYEWSAVDKLTQITDAAGNVRAFTFDGRGLRLTAEDLHDAADTTYGTWTYTYDDAGNLETSLSPNGVTVTYGYDEINRQTSEDADDVAGVEVSLEYDSCTGGTGKLCEATSTDATTSYTYDEADNTASETVTLDSTDYTTSYTYDYQGNVLTTTQPDGTTVTNTYNAIGKIETVDGAVSDTDYGPHGEVTSQINANGTVMTYTYDDAQRYRLTQKVTTGYDSAATTTTTTTSTATFYSSAGDGRVYKYNASWDTAHDATSGSGRNDTSTTCLVGTERTTTGYLIQRCFLPFDTSALPDDATVTGATLNVYVQSRTNQDNDGDDWITVVETSQASTSTLVADDFDQAGSVDNPTEGIDTSGRKDLSSVSAGSTAFTLNSTGFGWIATTGVTRLGLREGHDAIDSAFISSSTTTTQSNYLYVRLGEYAGTAYDPSLTVTYTQTTTSSTTSTAVTLQDLSYTYDAVGNITQIVDASETDGAKTTEYVYDDLFRLSSATVSGSANGDDGAISYAYDEIGNITSRSDAGTYAYDGTDYANPHAVTSIAQTDGTTVTYSYDENGNVTSDGTTSYTWDYKNRLIASDSAASSSSTTTTSASATFYPSAGDGYSWKYGASWDTAHDATSGSGADYTSTSQLLVGTGQTSTGYYFQRAFLPFDTSTLPDDATVTGAELGVFASGKKNNDDDGDDWITVVQSSQASVSALTSAEFDLAGSVDAPTEGIDASEREDLTGITTGAYFAFTLNATGLGWVSVTDETKLALREGHDVNDAAIAPAATPGYDYLYLRPGETTGTARDPYLTVTYTYPATTTVTTGSEVTYAYDHAMRRISKTSDSGATYYPSGDYSVTDGTSTVYVSGSSGLVASLENDGTTSTISTIHTDHLGSTSVITDEDGVMIELLDYNPYGTERISWSSSSSDGEAESAKTYIGEYSDQETNLSYLNARYYDPDRGQFLSQDSVFLGMGTGGKIQQAALLDPQLQNSYAYARGNPIALKDAGGNWPSFSQALNWAANATDAAYNAITFGAGQKAAEMGRTGLTVGGVAQVVGGVAFGTFAVGGTAATVGAGVGLGYLAAVPTSTAVTIGASFGKLGTVIASQAGKITGFFREGVANPFHGLDQAITRGVSPQVMLEAVKSPLVTLQQSGGNIMYLTQKAAVVLNQAGKVVTTYGSGQFKQPILNILKSVVK